MARMTKVSAAQAKQTVGTTDWNKLKSLSDAQIEASAAADPDTKPFVPQQLREFKRVKLKPSNKGSR